MRRVDLQLDRLPIDSLVVSSYPRSFVLDLALYLGELIEPPPRNMQKFSPFCLTSYACGSVWDMDFVVVVGVFALAREVDELEDEWPPRNDAAASGQEVSADDVLKYRRLSR